MPNHFNITHFTIQLFKLNLIQRKQLGSRKVIFLFVELFEEALQFSLILLKNEAVNTKEKRYSA